MLMLPITFDAVARMCGPNYCCCTDQRHADGAVCMLLLAALMLVSQ
jgi:hypothetical protein